MIKKTGVIPGFLSLKDIDKSDVSQLLKIRAKKLAVYAVLYQNFSIFEN